MSHQRNRRASRQQIIAIVSLYNAYASSLSVCGHAAASSRTENMEDGAFHPFSLQQRERGPEQLALPLIQETRLQRLAWASCVLHRDVHSFTELLPEEAATLIDTLKRAMGQPVKPPSRRPDRDQARAYGTAGRRNTATNEIRMVDDPTLELIGRLTKELGWTLDRLNAFLHSKTSPVRGGEILTLAQANRVIWALKNMLRARSSSKDSPPKGSAASRKRGE